VANQMWKQATPDPATVINKGDLNPIFVSRMHSIDKMAWEATLRRRWGTSPFTGKHDWADGSRCVSEPFSVWPYG